MVKQYDDEGEETGKGSNPIFDARLKYLDSLGIIMKNIAVRRVARDYQGWLGLVESLCDMNPYLNQKEREEIDVEIAKATSIMGVLETNNGKDPSLASWRVRRTGALTSALRRATLLCFRGLRNHNMLLPSSEAEEDELDMEAFLRESDL